ncbi:hypothetical protein ZIOFF_055275 [Zingiber officinale]|uniref:t-SNARE coiled-coil homology domain-containing protein n=1 Tax=Zingiber officinale TaxID=94328 RepID=A0A8J5KND7_ZINOF|nr:hypothetical protein ZIOFF_055275 [Zingiber officinale]
MNFAFENSTFLKYSRNQEQQQKKSHLLSFDIFFHPSAPTTVALRNLILLPYSALNPIRDPSISADPDACAVNSDSPNVLGWSKNDLKTMASTIDLLDAFNPNELNQFSADSFELARDGASGFGDIEMGRQVSVNSSEQGFEGFFTQVQDVEKQIDKLSQLLKNLQDANAESKTVLQAAAMKELKHRMDKDIDEVLRVARSVKSKLEELDRDNLANRKKPGCGKGSSVDRSRTATTVGLKNKLKERMNQFQALRETIQREYREILERRVYTVTGTHTDEETIDRLIETGNGEQIFAKAIQEQGRGQTHSEIQERHDVVRDIERKLWSYNSISITFLANYYPLFKIFLDMAVLVDAQGEMLDNIESEVGKADDYVTSGVGQLVKAKRLQRNTRKWTCIGMLILIAIIAAIVLGIVRP